MIVRMTNGKTLALEIKGEDSDQKRAKRTALEEWVKAVNSASGFGTWVSDVAFAPAEVHYIVARHAS
jgi:type III restriction enzyme